MDTAAVNAYVERGESRTTIGIMVSVEVEVSNEAADTSKRSELVTMALMRARQELSGSAAPNLKEQFDLKKIGVRG